MTPDLRSKLREIICDKEPDLDEMLDAIAKLVVESLPVDLQENDPGDTVKVYYDEYITGFNTALEQIKAAWE